MIENFKITIFLRVSKGYISRISLIYFFRVGQDPDIEVPIFVCLISFPTVQCSLHVFEPRYKRMVRECLESGSKKFGMCADDNTGTEYSDIGEFISLVIHS